MALTPTAGGRNLMLELDGQAAGALRSLRPAGVSIDRAVAARSASRTLLAGTTVSLGQMAAQFDLREPGPLLDWAGRLLAQKTTPVSGVVQVLDLNFKERRRLTFADATLVEVALPNLSATDARTPFSVGLKWQPGRVDDQAGSGAVLKSPISKRKPIQCANFRVGGLPFDASFIIEVGLPTCSVKLAQVDVRRPEVRAVSFDGGELRLRAVGRSAAEALGWVHKVVADGRLDAAESLDLKVEMLDAALKSVLASISLSGCALLSSEESELQMQAEARDDVTLRFAVAKTALVMTA